MASGQIKISDFFEENMCSICGTTEISQFFKVNDNFIEYCGVYYSFREIFAEALDLQINHSEGKTMEICYDCKDKTIKFYHFKRKVHEARKLHKSSSSHRNKSVQKEKRTKIVQNIVQIIEKYAEKCDVSKIQIDELGSKLIIESREDKNSNSLLHESDVLQNTEVDDEPAIDAKKIKEEPEIIFSEYLDLRHDNSASDNNYSMHKESSDDSCDKPSTSLDISKSKRVRKEIRHPANLKLNEDHQTNDEISDVESTQTLEKIKALKGFQNYANYYELYKLLPKGDKKHSRFKAKCKMCGHLETQSIGAGYSNLKRHLVKKHDGNWLV